MRIYFCYLKIYPVAMHGHNTSRFIYSQANMPMLAYNTSLYQVGFCDFEIQIVDLIKCLTCSPYNLVDLSRVFI